MSSPKKLLWLVWMCSDFERQKIGFLVKKFQQVVKTAFYVSIGIILIKNALVEKLFHIIWMFSYFDRKKCGVMPNFFPASYGNHNCIRRLQRKILRYYFLSFETVFLVFRNCRTLRGVFFGMFVKTAFQLSRGTFLWQNDLLEELF